MIRIAITPPLPAADHSRRIAMLLEAGADYVHLRYPGAEPEAYAAVVGAVAAPLRPRLTLHGGAFAIAGELGVGGLHLNSRAHVAPPGWSGRLSRGFHSPAEIAGRDPDEPLAYAMLSPIFASISKPGYGGGLSSRSLLESRSSIASSLPIIALGGVTPERVAEIAKARFDGYAMLGCLGWDLPIEEFKLNISKCYNL